MTVNDPRIKKPCFQICNIENGKIVPITEDLVKKTVKILCEEYYKVGNSSYEFVPTSGR